MASCNARNYESSLDRALENKNIPREVYFSLVESAQENTAPLRRYVKLRKKALKLKEYHYYDNSSIYCCKSIFAIFIAFI